MTIGLLCALLLTSPHARAVHNYPIKPVIARLSVEPGRIIVDIDSDSIYWIEEVTGLHPMPAKNWPETTQQTVAKYGNDALLVSADDRKLIGRLIRAEYTQHPWEIYEQGHIHLRFEYPDPGEAQTLSITARFFDEYRRERLDNHDPILPTMDFSTELSIAGRTKKKFRLTSMESSVSIALSDARRTLLSRIGESFLTGVKATLNAVKSWAGLAALGLSIAPGLPNKKRIWIIIYAGILGPYTASLKTPEWLEWAGAALAAGAAGHWLKDKMTRAGEGLAMLALSHCWAIEARLWLPGVKPGRHEQIASDMGQTAASFAAICLAVVLARANYRELTVHSASYAPDLFQRRRRLVSTALLIICGYGLFSQLA